jgi:hypothetical protein
VTVTGSVRYGAAWLLGMGVLISGLLVYGFATSRWACEDGYGASFACDLADIAVVVAAAITALHLLAGASLWRGHALGAGLGAVIAVLGVLGCASLLPHEPWWLVLPACAGYLGTSLVLAYGIAGWWARGRHPTRP